MTDKVTKLLSKLPPKQLKTILSVLTQIQSGDLHGLDVKILKGHPNTYRVRVGNYRIIFLNSNGSHKILLIAKRDEQTYKDL